jgi:hypothetical protein
MNLGKTFAIAAFLMIVLGSLAFPEQAAAQESETWTFMVYMSGDSSLSSNIPPDIQEMKNVGSSDKLDIIVLMDSSGDGDTSLARILPDGIENIPLSTVDAAWGNELDFGEPQTLSRFVIWAAGAYPADRYMLDLWGHGNGWPGICPDKSNYLETREVGTALSVISDAGVNLDIVSMDACQMGMIEVAYEIRNYADYALFSQKDVPLDGWPYDEFLRCLAGNGTVAEKGAAMIDAYIAWGKAHSMYSLTLSLIDLSGMGELCRVLDGYSLEATNATGYFNLEFAEARSLTEKYDGNAQFDLVQLLENINNLTRCKSLEVLADKALTILSASVIHETHWSNSFDTEKADYAHGLSIWFPTYAPTLDYLTTSFAQDTGWPAFLDSMSDYFQQPGRVETNYQANAMPLDSNDDDLLDVIRVSYGAPAAGTVTIEVYGPDGSLFKREIMTTEGTMDIPLDSFGRYQAAFYLKDAGGTLLNYSLFEDGLTKEGLSIISGYVKSNTGRGLKWVSMNLVDGTGQIVATTVTDGSGHYHLDVVVPTDTDGTGLVLVCGLGASQTNATIDSLAAENYFDFELETSGQYIGWIIRVVGILNLAGIVALIYWAAWGREKKTATENVEQKI